MSIPSDSHGLFESLQRSPVAIVGQQLRYRSGNAGEMHSHPRAQLLRAVAAPARIRTATRQMIVPPGQAVWLPGGMAHAVSSDQAPVYHSLYIRPDLAAPLSRDAGTLPASPFLDELMRRLIELDESRGDPSTRPHLTALILAELRQIRPRRQHLPLPADPRLQRICLALLKHPGDRSTLRDWARLAGASRRWVERHFQAETGMGFAEWRQICRAQAAVPLLEAGESVQRVAWMMGYASPSAFTEVFRKVLGITPRELRAEPGAGRDPDPPTGRH